MQRMNRFLIFVFICGSAGFFVNDDRFMSDVNLEQYYVLEENVLSNADILLRNDYFSADEEEGEEEHLEHAPNLTSFMSIINETKAVHRLAGHDLDTFLANPINFYHLIRRLDNGWRQGLDVMLQAKPCRQWKLPSITERLEYLQTNLPSKRELLRLVDYIASLQKMYKLKTEDIAEGKVGDLVSLRPLTLDEQFEIAKVFHDKEEMEIALQWLEHILKLLTDKNSPQDVTFNVTDVLNMMASDYYHMKNVEKAKEITEKVLEISPTNSIAESNLKFFSHKLDASKDKDNTSSAEKTVRKTVSEFERICARKKTKKVLKKSCKLVRNGILFYKMEIIRKKPYVVLFHDVIRNVTASYLKNFAHETLTENAWVLGVKFRPPAFTVEVNNEILRRNIARRHVRRLTRYLDSIVIADNRKPLLTDNLQLLNVGLEGTDIKKNVQKLHLKPSKINSTWTEVGAYFVFLNEVKTGGEVVFPKLGHKIHPDLGSVLFYQVTPDTAHSFCPVVGSTLWVAVRPIHEKRKDYCTDEDEWL